MNGDGAHYVETDAAEMAFAIVDRTLTAIGGLEHEDPMRALQTVLAMYKTALTELSE